MIILYTVANCVPDPLRVGHQETKPSGPPIAFRCPLKEGEFLSLRQLKQVFPGKLLAWCSWLQERLCQGDQDLSCTLEQGDFHFRLKIEDPRYPGQFPARFVWQDVTRNEERVLPQGQEQVVEVRALPVNFTVGRRYTVDSEFGLSGERSPISSISSSPYFSEQEHGGESEYLEFFQDGPPQSLNTNSTAAKIEAEFAAQKRGDVTLMSSWREKDSSPRAVLQEERREPRNAGGTIQSSASRDFTNYSVAGSSKKKAEGLFGKLGRSSVNFFKAGAKAAISLASEVSASHTASYPSAAQKNNLEVVADMLRVPAGPDLLKSVWKVIFPSEVFVPRGPQWQLVGFKADDPLKDDNVARAGILGLQSLCEFVQEYPSDAKMAVQGGVPIARISLDVTLSLAVLLGLTDLSFPTKKRSFWRLFNVSPLVFCTLSSYTTQISIRNHDSSKSHKGSVASAVRMMEHILGEAPADLQEVKSIGSALGLNFL